MERDFVARNATGAPECVLLLLDRKEDPVTPLLNQWTYQAMIHELIGINKNRVDLKVALDPETKSTEVVLSPDMDAFFSEHLTANFGEMAEALNSLVKDFQQKTKSQAKVESIEEMQRFVESYPEFRRTSGNVTKHVNVMSELSKMVEVKKLLDVSRLEQDIATAGNKGEQSRELQTMLDDPQLSSLEKLRLVLLYSVRYENDSKIFQFKEKLRKSGVSNEQILIIDSLMEYAGKAKRGGELFSNKGILEKAMKIFKRLVRCA